MEILLTLNKNEVMQEVSKVSAYIGAKAIKQDGENRYGDIAITKEEEETLDRYWGEACANIAASAHDYLKETIKADGEDNASFILSLKMPYGYDMSTNTQVYQYAYSYAVSYILMKWLVICGFTTNMELYMSTTASNLKSFADALRIRNYGSMAVKTDSNMFGGDIPQNIGAEDVIIKRL